MSPYEEQGRRLARTWGPVSDEVVEAAARILVGVEVEDEAA